MTQWPVAGTQRLTPATLPKTFLMSRKGTGFNGQLQMTVNDVHPHQFPKIFQMISHMLFVDRKTNVDNIS